MRSTAKLLFVFLYFTITCFIDAQITIDGTVTDSDLNPISNALVEIIDEADTSNRYNDVTDASGNFTISNITDIPSISTTPPTDHIILRNYPNPFNP
ncbi:MAG: carboxypeptidase regulatory-like domain-containing protein, partial [Melioribacteraceae bacterium]|nr:carboxypeptidase regulatory-like domain-containing protein [Melioribacteraceae bacterium]